MRILHLIWGLGGGGAERQLAALAPELASRGHDVHVAYSHDGIHSRGIALHCALYPVRRGVRYDPRLALRVIALVRRLRPDLVHTWLEYMDVLGGLAAMLLRVPWVLGERYAGPGYAPTALNRARHTLGRRAQLVVANSSAGADYWRGRGLLYPHVEVVPNFVPTREIASAAPLEDSRLAADDELVLHVGRLVPQKNIAALIDAFQRVCALRPRARLALCGDGPLRKQLVARVLRAGLGDRVIFAGFVENVWSWMKRSKVMVALSLCEGHPNAVLEAMAAGAPLVLAEIPAYRALLDERTALFVTQRDPVAAARAITDVLDRPAAAAQRAAEARTRTFDLTLDATTSRYERLYAAVLAPRGQIDIAGGPRAHVRDLRRDL